MFTRSPFHHRQLTHARLIALCALLFIVGLAAFHTSAPRSQASGQRQRLTFEERVEAQRAIEAVYHRHRLWPTDKRAAQTGAKLRIG